MELIQELLTINTYSRPGSELKKVKGIVVHWVANPNSTAKQNRDFFESRKQGKKGYGSAHYIINLDGSILQCIPDEEVAYHVGANKYTQKCLDNFGSNPNDYSLGIECTHTDWNGKMPEITYEKLVDLCVNLCDKYNLEPKNNLYRHYDITGKLCHKWFVQNEDKWYVFKNKVNETLNEKKVENVLNVNINETIQQFEGFILEGKSYVELKKLVEMLGYNVAWDNENKIIKVSKIN